MVGGKSKKAGDKNKAGGEKRRERMRRRRKRRHFGTVWAARTSDFNLSITVMSPGRDS